MAGLLESLAQILPYAIPAAAGAALGGPGLGMVGAGGAAAAKAGALDEQSKLAALVNESQYRNADLGLRQQEIQSNEALRKDALKQQGGEFQQRQQQTAGEFQQREQDRQLQMQMIADHQRSTEMLMAQGRQLQAAALQAHTDEAKDKLAQQYKENVRARIQGAQALAERAGKDAVTNAGMWEKYVGKGKENIEDSAKDKAYADALRHAGLTKDDLLNAGVDQDIINKVYPSPQKLEAKAAAGKSDAPQVVNGRKVVQVPKSADYPTGLKYVN